MIDGNNVFDQTVKSGIRKDENIRKITAGQRDDYAIGCLLDFNYFNNYYKMIAINESKQEALDANPKAMQQINFNWNLERDNGAIVFFIFEKPKETVLELSQGIVKVLCFYFVLI